eukprot:scaffold581_cov263-Pinguiococcus_pyrenoidosus.AAC.3
MMLKSSSGSKGFGRYASTPARYPWIRSCFPRRSAKAAGQRGSGQLPTRRHLCACMYTEDELPKTTQDAHPGQRLRGEKNHRDVLVLRQGPNLGRKLAPW